MIKGYATPEGTEAFKRRFEGKLHDSHFREFKGLFFSSLGIGSYLGDPDDATDLLYERALKAAVASGVNVIDAAINYRCQRSERSFGRALAELISSGVVNREEVIVCTKGGFLPFDSAYPDDPLGYFRETSLNPGL